MNDDVRRFREYLQDKHNLKQINETKEMVDELFDQFQNDNNKNNSESEEKSRNEED